jgi:hypothetical protein
MEFETMVKEKVEMEQGRGKDVDVVPESKRSPLLDILDSATG